MPGNHLVAALDAGTTGTRCLIVDHLGRSVASAYKTHEQHYPQPGWVEHDPIEILQAAVHVIHAAAIEANIAVADLSGIGITNQRETTVLWEAESGNPIHRAIVWQDRRTADRIDALSESTSALIRERTGLHPDAYFSATKLEWLLSNAANTQQLRQAKRGELRFGTIDSWLIDQLAGVHVTDSTNASRTMLFDIHREEWDAALLEIFGIPQEILPTVRPSIDATPYGITNKDGPLGASIPVAGALGDQQAALFGQTCFDRGEAKNTYGTGSFLLLNTGEEPVESEHGLITTIAYGLAGTNTRYALEGSIFNTGATIQWLVDVGIIDHPAETDELARSVVEPNEVYLVPAFTGLGAPHWDPRARGTLLGLTRDTNRAHIARAALESIGFLTRDVIEAMTADANMPISDLRIDGGAVSNDMLCQLQADILDRPVLRPTIEETTALGAAYAAGLTVGVWDSLDELREQWDISTRFEPQADPEAIAARYARWKKAIERSKQWAASEGR